MSTNIILEAIHKSLVKQKRVTVNLKEASALTGSGSNVGGRVIYDDAFLHTSINSTISFK